jgi:hypothetical protein
MTHDGLGSYDWRHMTHEKWTHDMCRDITWVWHDTDTWHMTRITSDHDTCMGHGTYDHMARYTWLWWHDLWHMTWQHMTHDTWTPDTWHMMTPDHMTHDLWLVIWHMTWWLNIDHMAHTWMTSTHDTCLNHHDTWHCFDCDTWHLTHDTWWWHGQYDMTHDTWHWTHMTHDHAGTIQKLTRAYPDTTHDTWPHDHMTHDDVCHITHMAQWHITLT